VNLEITTRGYEATKRVRETLEERTEKFSKYISDVQQIRVTLTGERVDFLCEVHVHSHGKDFHSKAATSDMLASVDKACASMEQQLRRAKDRRSGKHARNDHNGETSAAALESELASMTDDGEDEDLDQAI